MAQWLRFAQGASVGFGTLEGPRIAVHAGDMFTGCQPTGQTLALADVTLLAPCVPTKMPALWNNFYERATKENGRPGQHPERPCPDGSE